MGVTRGLPQPGERRAFLGISVDAEAEDSGFQEAHGDPLPARLPSQNTHPRTPLDSSPLGHQEEWLLRPPMLETQMQPWPPNRSPMWDRAQGF